MTFDVYYGTNSLRKEVVAALPYLCEQSEALVKKLSKPAGRQSNGKNEWEMAKALRGAYISPVTYMFKWETRKFEFLVARTREAIQGLAIFTMYPKEGVLEIDLLATAPENLDVSVNQTTRIRGVGTALIKKAIEICKKRGGDKIKLSSSDSSMKFYINRGFQPEPNGPKDSLIRSIGQN